VTVADRLAASVGPDHPDPAAVAAIRHFLDDELDLIVADWDGPGPPLGISKGRLLATARCPASVLAEAEPMALSVPLVEGAALDVAAAMIAVSDKVPGTQPWLGALLPVMRQTEPDHAELIESLSVEDRDEVRERVHAKGERLRALLGDVRDVPVTTQEMFRAELAGGRVSLSGRTDLVLGRGARTVVEVKSGSVRPAHVDEAGFYALVAAMRDGVAPRSVIVVTLDPGVVTDYPVTLDSLEAGAHRVLDAVRVLVDLDRAVVDGRWPVTTPGEQCAWCGVLERCPDAPDLARAQAQAATEPPEIDDDEHEPW